MGDVLLVFLLLFFCSVLASARRLNRGAPNATAAPLSVPISQVWDGGPGNWSSFTIQIGTSPRAQSIRVLPSTGISQTWVIGIQGCPKWFIGGIEDCIRKRGGLFNGSDSLVWMEENVFLVGDMAIVGDRGYRNLSLDFGWDMVSVGNKKSGNVSVPEAPVALLADWGYSLLGLLGLDPRPTNFSTLMDSADTPKSFMNKLKDKNAIPSLSYGYTAGASYRGEGVFGSLTLGGYDTNRLFNNYKATFPFFEDTEIPLFVDITSIDWDYPSTRRRILQQPHLKAYIDSSQPFIYLPPDSCNVIEQVFNLKWDNASQYYLVDENSEQRLRERNAFLRFNLEATSSDTSRQLVNITLPFGALVQTLEYPYTNNQTRYFPLRPTTNQNPAVLGRTFLQEAYLAVDHERKNFTVYQARFPETGTPQSLSVIEPVIGAEAVSRRQSLSSAAIGGIVGGIALALMCMLLLLLQRSRKRKRRAAVQATDMKELHSQFIHESNSTNITEVDSKVLYEMDSGPGVSRAEIAASQTPTIGEMPDTAQTSTYRGFFSRVEADGNADIAETHGGEASAISLHLERNTSRSAQDCRETLATSSNMLVAPGSLSNGADDRSPIPETPLELYGPVAGDKGPRRRGWIGRLPGLPKVILTPATPTSPTVRKPEKDIWLEGRSGAIT